MVTQNGLTYNEIKPAGKLALYVESFWMLVNNTGTDTDIVLLPDGRIDVSVLPDKKEYLSLHGLESHASQTVIPEGITMYAISFRPPALEYFFKPYLPALPDTVQTIPLSALGLEYFTDFNSFCSLATEKLLQLLPAETDSRREKLFSLIYEANGAITVKELSEKTGWGSRQINRYCNGLIGMPLKTYCNILRFRASLGHLKQGKLFPALDYADQSHFIREIKKYAGVAPKELARNKNDRFIQFYLFPGK